jgi:hypothetical protein
VDINISAKAAATLTTFFSSSALSPPVSVLPKKQGFTGAVIQRVKAVGQRQRKLQIPGGRLDDTFVETLKRREHLQRSLHHRANGFSVAFGK